MFQNGKKAKMRMGLERANISIEQIQIRRRGYSDISQRFILLKIGEALFRIKNLGQGV